MRQVHESNMRDEPMQDSDGLEGVEAGLEMDANLDFESEEESEAEIDIDALDLDMSDDGGVSVPVGRAISPSSLPFLNPTENVTTELSISAVDNDTAHLNPQRPTPYVHDAGHLLVTDPNPFPKTTAANLEVILASNARDATQSLLNHLLTTCPIHKVNITSTSSSGITMALPASTFALPREKKIPQSKPPTKWEQFAARKGIGKTHGKGGGTQGGELRNTEGTMVYDEATGEWVRRWGYKGRNKKGEGDWLVEVDEKKERENGEAGNARSDSRAQRVERMRRNERAQRANEKRARRGKA